MKHTRRTCQLLFHYAGPARAGLWACVAVIACALAIAGAPGALAASPQAVKGVLDLSSWDFARDGVVRLGGEWAFYWQRLVDPFEFRVPHASGSGASGQIAAEPPAPEPPAFVRVPGSWNAFSEGRSRGDGYATYRLLILSPPPSERLALYIPYEQTSYRLFANGRLIGSNGVVGVDRASAVPEYRPVVVRVEPGDEPLELVLHVSNFAHRVGGLWNAPILATEPLMDMFLSRRLSVTTFLAGAMLFMALYHFVLFALRPTYPATAYLAGLSACIALRAIIMGDHVISWHFPKISWEAQVRLEYVAGFVALGLFALLMNARYPVEAPARLVRPLAWFWLAGGVCSLVLPVSLTSHLIPYVEVLVAVQTVYFVWISLLTVKRRRQGSAFFTAGGLALAVALMLDLLYYNRIILAFNMTPVGFFALLIAQSFILAQEFAGAYRRQNTLLAALRESQGLLTRMEEAQRREVAEFLHGPVQGRLAAAYHALQAAAALVDRDPERAKSILEVVARSIDGVREDDIRKASHALHPAQLEAGLLPALRELAAGYRDAFRVEVHSDPEVAQMDRLTLTGEAGGIARPISLVIYRVVEECLSNASKHAQAKVVRVSLGKTPEGKLEATVADDGVGFDPSRDRTGLGTAIIRARASLVGGEAHIVSEVGRGTTVRVVVPLEVHGDSPNSMANRAFKYLTTA